MLTLAIIVAAALLGLLAAILLRKQTVRFPRRLLVGGLVVALVGITLTFYAANRVGEGLGRRYWPSVVGIVTDSRVEGVRAARANVTYEYEVNGFTLLDSCNLNQPAFGGRSRRTEAAVKLIALYPPGKEVLVYYDPDRPGKSTLVPTVFWAHYGMTGLGAVLLAAGVCLAALSMAATGRVERAG